MDLPNVNGHLLLKLSFTFLLFIEPIQSLVCSPGTESALLIDDYNENPSFMPCLRQCAQQNCTGVLLSKTSCISLNTADFYGPIDMKKFVEKKCIPGLTKSLLIKKSMNRVLIGQTEKVVSATDELDCVKQCSEETSFKCASTMFYGDVNDCFLNYANSTSTSSQMSNDTDGFSVDFFEFSRISREICGKSRRSKGFTLIAQKDHFLVRGDVEIVESETVEECLDDCPSCDFAIFDEKTSTCQRIVENLSGQEISNPGNGSMLFEKLCRSRRISCGREKSVYVMRDRLDDRLREECLTSCLNSPTCTYGYATSQGCISSEKSLPHLRRVLERKCIKKMPRLENGIIFEEISKCLTGSSQKIERISRNDCFLACLNHSNKSCDSVTYHRQTAFCEIFEIGQEKFPSDERCHHYALSVFSLAEDLVENTVNEIPNSTRIRKEGLPIKRIPELKAKSLASKTFPLPISPDPKHREGGFVRRADKSKNNDKNNKTKSLENLNLFEKIQTDFLPEISVKPTCRFDSILVQIESATLFNGTVFPRNLHEKCSMKIVNGRGNLSLELGNNSRCTAEFDKNNNIYKTVLIVKSKSEDNQILTENDRLFHISCKYRENHTTIAKSKPLGIEPPSAKNLAVKGVVSSPKQMQMKTIGRSTPQIVHLGEPVQLNFEDSSLKDGFNLDKCYATDSKGFMNISLVQYGCTVSGNNHVVTHRIRYLDNGFTFAIRAFKFADGETVRITCLVRKCVECKRPSCHSISKRSLNESLSVGDSRPNFEEIVAEFLVKTETFPKMVCSKRSSLIFVCSIFASILTVEAVFFVFLLRKRISTKA